MKQEIFDALKAESPFFSSDIHGIHHWQTVERNGHYLAQFTGADVEVISYFAHFHDCMRENEDKDPKHGLRGALFAEKHRNLIDLSDLQFKQMTDACKAYTGGRKMSCATIATCWDADRLDLGRVGISPVSEFLFSSEAKRIADLNDYSVLGMNPSSLFKDGEKDSLHTEWYENGQKLSEEYYKNGKKDGRYATWYENGQKRIEAIYKNGKENGLFILWYSNGLKWEETKFQDGKRVAPKKQWTFEGQLKHSVEKERIESEAETKHKLEAETKRKRDAAVVAKRIEGEAGTAMGMAVGAIQAAVHSNWTQPRTSTIGLEVLVRVNIRPGGVVTSARVIKSSGNALFDVSAEIAVLKASPLPIPSNPRYYPYIKEFDFRFRPNG